MSFSKEMKDFLGAWQTVSKINATGTDQDYKIAQTEAQQQKTAHDYDPERVKLGDEQSRAQLAQTQAQISNLGATGRLTEEQIKNAPVNRAYTGAITQRMIDAGKEKEAAPAGTGYLPQPYAPGAAVGGGVPLQNTMIPAYADGGAIPDDEEDDPTLPPPTPSMEPAVGGAPAGVSTDVSARAKTVGGIAPQLFNDAMAAIPAGYKGKMKMFGLDGTSGIKTAAQKKAAIAMQQGAGGLSPQEMEAARNAVDPEKKLTDSQRNLAALGSVYQFWQNKGEPEKAEKVAGQMLQHYRAASERYAAIAAHAAESGNVPLAAQAALKAYANIPDGRDMQLQVDPSGKIIYSFTDENGKAISKGVATPQELASSAMGLAAGGFDKALLSAAGQREAAQGAVTSKGKAGKGEGGVDPGKQKGFNELVDPAIDKAKAEWVKKNKGAEPNDTAWSDIKDAALHIMDQNKVSEREAVTAAQRLVMPSSDRTASWKTTDNPDGSVSLKMDSGMKINMSGDQFDSLMNQRAAYTKAANAAEEAAKTAGPSRGEQAMEGVKQAAGGVARAVSEADPVEVAGALANPLSVIAKRVGPAVADALQKTYGEHIPQSIVDAFMDAKSMVKGGAETIASDVRNVGALVPDALRGKGAIPDDSYNSPM